MGWINAPICHTHVVRMRDGMPERDSIMSYMDDILICAHTRDKNLEILDKVLQKIQETGF